MSIWSECHRLSSSLNWLFVGRGGPQHGNGGRDDGLFRRVQNAGTSRKRAAQVNAHPRRRQTIVSSCAAQSSFGFALELTEAFLIRHFGIFCDMAVISAKSAVQSTDYHSGCQIGQISGHQDGHCMKPRRVVMTANST
jgi:hypothetical protein